MNLYIITDKFISQFNRPMAFSLSISHLHIHFPATTDQDQLRSYTPPVSPCIHTIFFVDNRHSNPSALDTHQSLYQFSFHLFYGTRCHYRSKTPNDSVLLSGTFYFNSVLFCIQLSAFVLLYCFCSYMRFVLVSCTCPQYVCSKTNLYNYLQALEGFKH